MQSLKIDGTTLELRISCQIFTSKKPQVQKSKGKVSITLNTIWEMNFQCCILARSATQSGRCTWWCDIQHSKTENTGQDAYGISYSVLYSPMSNTDKLVVIQRGEKTLLPNGSNI